MWTRVAPSWRRPSDALPRLDARVVSPFRARRNHFMGARPGCRSAGRPVPVGCCARRACRRTSGKKLVMTRQQGILAIGVAALCVYRGSVAEAIGAAATNAVNSTLSDDARDDEELPGTLSVDVEDDRSADANHRRSEGFERPCEDAGNARSGAKPLADITVHMKGCMSMMSMMQKMHQK